MISLFTNSKVNTLVGVVGLSVVGSLAATIWYPNFYLQLGLAVLALLCLFGLMNANNRSNYLLGKIKSFTEDVVEGKLEGRITNIGAEDDLGQIAWNFNEALDQMETVLREANAFARKVKAGDY